MTIRVGLGRSDTGKILDYRTQWYNYDIKKGIDERPQAIQFASETGRLLEIFVSANSKAYRKVTEEQLMKL